MHGVAFDVHLRGLLTAMKGFERRWKWRTLERPDLWPHLSGLAYSYFFYHARPCKISHLPGSWETHVPGLPEHCSVDASWVPRWPQRCFKHRKASHGHHRYCPSSVWRFELHKPSERLEKAQGKRELLLASRILGTMRVVIDARSFAY